MKFLKTHSFITIFLVILLLTACGGAKSEGDFVGKWISSESYFSLGSQSVHATLEFFSDGTVRLVAGENLMDLDEDNLVEINENESIMMGMNIMDLGPSTYTLLEGNLVQFDGGAAVFLGDIHEYDFPNKDTLILKLSDFAVYEFERVAESE